MQILDILTMIKNSEINAFTVNDPLPLKYQERKGKIGSQVDFFVYVWLIQHVKLDMEDTDPILIKSTEITC